MSGKRSPFAFGATTEEGTLASGGVTSEGVAGIGKSAMDAAADGGDGAKGGFALFAKPFQPKIRSTSLTCSGLTRIFACSCMCTLGGSGSFSRFPGSDGTSASDGSLLEAGDGFSMIESSLAMVPLASAGAGFSLSKFTPGASAAGPGEVYAAGLAKASGLAAGFAAALAAPFGARRPCPRILVCSSMLFFWWLVVVRLWQRSGVDKRWRVVPWMGEG